MKTSAIAVVTAVAVVLSIGALVGVSNRVHLPGGSALPAHPFWIEVAWPFPIDQWGRGRAFQCKATDCGVMVALYVRPKLGSCNCKTGVASDADLDRMSDFDLLGADVLPLADGRPVTIGWMKGRSRAYAIAGRGRNRSAMSVVFNDRCDMIVATIVLAADPPATVEPGIMEFLNSTSMLHWAELVLGV